MENETPLSAEQSLQLIEGMINKAKNRFSDDSFLYLLWGWVILICSVGQFIILKFSLFNNSGMIWVLTWVAVVVQIIYLVKRKKKEKVKTYADELIGFLWMTFGISMLLLTFILSKTNTWAIMYPVVLMMYGIPTFLTGVVMKFTPLKVGGISCWVLSIIATFLAPIYMLLLVAIAMLTAWIIPGYLLRNLYKKQVN